MSLMNKMTVGERIRLRREELGFTQEELAFKLGYKDRSSITRIEQDGRELPLSKIKAIAEALMVTPGFIMGWEDQNEDELVLSPHDERVIRAYKAQPDLQYAVDRLLGIKD